MPFPVPIKKKKNFRQIEKKLNKNIQIQIIIDKIHLQVLANFRFSYEAVFIVI